MQYEPTDDQIAAGIAAAEAESKAWNIRPVSEGAQVDDLGRLSIKLPGMVGRPITKKTFPDLESARMFVKWKVWSAGIKAALNG